MPTKERLADRNVTTTELALILGITGRRVQQLTQDGVLTTVSRGKFVLSDAVQAYIGSISRGGLTKEEAEEAKKIERVKAKAEATLKTSKAKIAQAEAQGAVWADAPQRGCCCHDRRTYLHHPGCADGVAQPGGHQCCCSIRPC